MQTETGICKDCGHPIAHVFDKALDGTTALVWADSTGDWICEPTGDEHVPDGPDSVFMRDLERETEGMHATETLDDAVYNGIVDAIEGHGHSRARTEYALREWLLWGDAEPVEDDEPSESPMDPEEALSYAILAINDATEPMATSGNDRLYLECNAERALAALVRIRDYVIASGEDLPAYAFGKGE